MWAGSAAAQTSDGWFDDSAQAPAPPAADEGSAPDAPSQPDDSPPPPDFQTPPPAAAPAAPEDADAPENDAEAQTRAVQEFSDEVVIAETLKVYDLPLNHPGERPTPEPAATVLRDNPASSRQHGCEGSLSRQ